MFRMNLGAIITVAFLSVGQVFAQTESPWYVHDIYAFQRGLDINDFQTTWSQGRDEVLQTLMDHFLEALESGAMGMEALTAILEFEKIYDERKNSAARGMTFTMQAQFESELTRLYRKHRIAESQKKFVLKRGIRGEDDLLRGVNAIALGTWTNVDGYTMQLSIKVIHIEGWVRSYDVEGPTRNIGHLLAREVFDDFQRIRHQSPTDPTAKKQWLVPGPNTPTEGVPRVTAVNDCKRQGARLPFAEEIDLAALNGPYHNPGIVTEVGHGVWYHVADQTWRKKNRGWYYDKNAYPDTRGRRPDGKGMVRPYTEEHYPGLITTRHYGRYYCIIGAPIPRIQLVYDLYAITREYWPNNKVDSAAKCMLKKLNAYGYNYTEKTGDPCHSFLTHRESPWKYLKETQVLSNDIELPQREIEAIEREFSGRPGRVRDRPW